MFKLEIECYGGKVIVVTDFINFANDIGELIEQFQNDALYSEADREIDKEINKQIDKEWDKLMKPKNEKPVRKRGRPLGSGKKL